MLNNGFQIDLYYISGGKYDISQRFSDHIHWPRNSTSKKYPTEILSRIHTDLHINMFTAVLFAIVQY